MNSYDDIINLDRPISKHKKLSIDSRAAQFAPFAALTGYDNAVKEMARLTDKRIEIDEGIKEMLSNKLYYIQENINVKPEVSFMYFILDSKKTGGKYVEKVGVVRKIDMIEQYVQLMDKSKIPINEILSIESDIFETLIFD